MATIDGTGGKQPRYVHAGAITVRTHYTWAATASVGDVLQMVKVPDGAVIDNLVVYATGGDHGNVGDGVSVARYFASASIMTTTHVLLRVEGVQAGIGYKYDISDAAEPHYDTIDIGVLVADSSVGDVTTMIVSYHCDEID